MRATTAARFVIGAVASVVPARVVHLTGAPVTLLDRRVTRVLGARYLAQAVLARTAGTPARVDAAVDLVHAASMVPVAVLSRRYRRAALASAGVALVLGTVDLVRPEHR